MPAELRHIIFSTADIAEAIAGQQASAGRHYEPGSVANLHIQDSASGPIVTVTMREAQTGAMRSVELDGAALGAAMMKFCFSRKIPLPKNATKSLLRVNDQLALAVAIGGTASRHAHPDESAS